MRFDHAGLLVNRPPGTAGLPFNQSSDDLAEARAELRVRFNEREPQASITIPP